MQDKCSIGLIVMEMYEHPVYNHMGKQLSLKTARE